MAAKCGGNLHLKSEEIPVMCVKKVIDTHTQIIVLLGCEKMYLPLYKVADAPFHIQVDDLSVNMVMVKSQCCY